MPEDAAPGTGAACRNGVRSGADVVLCLGCYPIPAGGMRCDLLANAEGFSPRYQVSVSSPAVALLYVRCLGLSQRGSTAMIVDARLVLAPESHRLRARLRLLLRGYLRARPQSAAA